jgi:hypothetical protein
MQGKSVQPPVSLVEKRLTTTAEAKRTKSPLDESTGAQLLLSTDARGTAVDSGRRRNHAFGVERMPEVLVKILREELIRPGVCGSEELMNEENRSRS